MGDAGGQQSNGDSAGVGLHADLNGDRVIDHVRVIEARLVMMWHIRIFSLNH